jgi:hypothetical protein
MIVVVGLLAVAFVAVAVAGVAAGSGGIRRPDGGLVIFGQHRIGLSAALLLLFGVVAGLLIQRRVSRVLAGQPVSPAMRPAGKFGGNGVRAPVIPVMRPADAVSAYVQAWICCRRYRRPPISM